MADKDIRRKVFNWKQHVTEPRSGKKMSSFSCIVIHTMSSTFLLPVLSSRAWRHHRKGGVSGPGDGYIFPEDCMAHVDLCQGKAWLGKTFHGFNS